jgi:peptide deformylase
MKEKDPNVLSINIAEEIRTREVPPGTSKPSAKEKEEALPAEEVEKRRKVMMEYSRLSARYCDPHTLKSKWVEDIDLPRVLSDGKDLVAMCNLPRGRYSGIAALAHTQIDDKNPLRFFVFPKGMVIINPIIIKNTSVPLFKNEASMSYPDKDVKTMIPRYNKITVMYQTLFKKDEDSDVILSDPITEELSGGAAHVFQANVGYLNGPHSDIYADDFDPSSALWLGEGTINEENLKKLYKTILK